MSNPRPPAANVIRQVSEDGRTQSQPVETVAQVFNPQGAPPAPPYRPAAPKKVLVRFFLGETYGWPQFSYDHIEIHPELPWITLGFKNDGDGYIPPIRTPGVDEPLLVQVGDDGPQIQAYFTGPVPYRNEILIMLYLANEPQGE